MVKSEDKFPFTKMHGTGNDFVIVERGNLLYDVDFSFLAKIVCNRRFGVGSDGLIIVDCENDERFRMIFFNPDGSPSEMCGNGLRCFGKYVYENGLTKSDFMYVHIGNSTVPVRLFIENGIVNMVEVSIGKADFTRKNIPVLGDGDTALAEMVKLEEGMEYEIFAVSMGNPHAVIMVDDVDNFPVKTVGSQIEKHQIFPDRVNVEFVQYISPETVKVRIWERGAGETLSCGSGVCAVAAVLRRLGLVAKSVMVQVPGGELYVSFDENETILLKGPAETVFTGFFPYHKILNTKRV